jgi:hypothetical protein
MRLSRHTSGYGELTFSIDEARKVLNGDEDALSELASHFDKYVTWIDDVKRINTKQLLESSH